ncbi:hypothetical protein [Streptomyces sp. NPDC127038]|uniref:hypothetical protein n=1 Tax=Streptomyces sp. NPDC127038 TaxID=3347114 RepID=UPI00366645F1
MSSDPVGKGWTGGRRRVLVGAVSTGAALALWAVVRLIVRMAFVAHAPWIDELFAVALLVRRRRHG